MTKTIKTVRGYGATLAVCVLALTTPAAAQDSCAIVVNGETFEPDLKKGKRAFLKCRACHTLAPGKPNKVGPNLGLIFEREPNSAEGFAYSAAFKANPVQWTPDAMDSFVENPRKFMPGSKMLFAGIRSASERANVIAYLRQETNPDFSCEG